MKRDLDGLVILDGPDWEEMVRMHSRIAKVKFGRAEPIRVCNCDRRLEETHRWHCAASEVGWDEFE